MNIIIAGAGKVGFNLAKTLSISDHVTVIDRNKQALDRIQESLDILALSGDAKDPDTYRSFRDQEIDLFIAVTQSDDANLIAIMVADGVLNIKKKFVRLQNHFLEEKITKEQFHIDKVIFPTRLISETVSSLLPYPRAYNVKFFKYTPLKLIAFMVTGEIDIDLLHADTFKIVGIEREKKFFVPQDINEVRANDLVYFFGDETAISSVCQSIDSDQASAIQRCVIFGAGELGIAIARALLAQHRDVKLVEKELSLCEEADELLEGKATVINYKYGSHDVFEDEGLENADIFIAATKNDEYNIIKCLEAKESGIKKVVAVNNEVEYYNLMHTFGIVVVRGPKMSIYNTIMEEIASTGVVIQKSFCGTKANVLVRKVFPASKLIAKTIKSAKVNASALYYVRENLLYPLQSKMILQENDLIIAFAPAEEIEKVKQWIYEL